VGQSDLPHVDVLLVERVVELDALQLVRPFLTLLQELLPFLHIINAVRVILELLIPHTAVLTISRPALIQCVLELLQLFLLVDECLIEQFALLCLPVQFFTLQSAELFVENLVLFHAQDDVFQAFSLHSSVFELLPNS
jgi:hypothetical protein